VKHLSVGSQQYRIDVNELDGRWVAHAMREDTGERFGADGVGATETEAVDRLKSWLEWQAAHAAALETLKAAERAYHRAVAGEAFAGPSERTLLGLPRQLLDAVEAARLSLDEIRARMPDSM
jgi:hypothetical protein